MHFTMLKFLLTVLDMYTKTFTFTVFNTNSKFRLWCPQFIRSGPFQKLWTVPGGGGGMGGLDVLCMSVVETSGRNRFGALLCIDTTSIAVLRLRVQCTKC